ncbi:MAG: pyridoxal phosphate-dependent aminotransferase [Pseudomonadota bacterium]
MNYLKNKNLTSINPFLAMEILMQAQELQRQGRDIIHLAIGEPDFHTPDSIVQAGIQAIHAHQTKYTHTQGTLELRQAIAEKYAVQGIKVDPQQILVSAGSSLLLYLAFRILVAPGEELIMTDPGYPCYFNLATLAGAKVKRFRLYREDGYLPDVAKLKKMITKKTRAIIINNPMNPTGVVFPAEILKALGRLPVPIISDEIYSDLAYEGEHHSMLKFQKDTILLSGFSKSYAMTGWRLGYMVLPKKLVSIASKIHQNIMISAPHFVQDAGIAALKHTASDLQHMAGELNRRRLFLLGKLDEMGLSPGYRPTAAYYVLWPYPKKGKSLNLAKDILNKCGVALTPGVDFGPSGEGHLRLSYANSIENIGEALRRLGEYFKI